jgi:hypothetical protein
VTWKQNEAFNALHRARVRANPHAQLFLRVVDDVGEPPSQDFDVPREPGAGADPTASASCETAATHTLGNPRGCMLLP